jgi:hypothetical protein
MKLSERVVKVPVEKPVAAILKRPVAPVYTTGEPKKDVYTKHGKHKDADAHKLKMREYQRKRRAKVKMPSDEQFMAALGPCGK